MNVKYYEFENLNKKNKYDGLREYCLNEHINEEYLRASINKTIVWRCKLNIENLLIRFFRFEERSKQKA